MRILDDQLEEIKRKFTNLRKFILDDLTLPLYAHVHFNPAASRKKGDFSAEGKALRSHSCRELDDFISSVLEKLSTLRFELDKPIYDKILECCELVVKELISNPPIDKTDPNVYLAGSTLINMFVAGVRGDLAEKYACMFDAIKKADSTSAAIYQRQLSSGTVETDLRQTLRKNAWQDPAQVQSTNMWTLFDSSTSFSPNPTYSADETTPLLQKPVKAC